MSKIYINIIVPALEKEIELRVSPKLKVGKLASMLKEYLLKESETSFNSSINCCICDARNGKKCSENLCLAEIDICDGDELLLI